MATGFVPARVSRFMAALSPTDVAFEGFRLTRERPRAVLAWALCYLAFTFALAVAAYLTLG